MYFAVAVALTLSLTALPVLAQTGGASAQDSEHTQKGRQAGRRDNAKAPRLRDALRNDERERMLQSIARRNPGFALKAVRNKRFHADQPVLLLMEKRPRDKSQPNQRLADAYYYDYRSDETIHCIVDADTGEVHEQRRVADLQLPLTEDEIQRAFDILLQSPHRSDLAAAYRDVTGQSLIDIGKVHYKAYVFHASANSARLNNAAKKCGRTRCAQMLLYTNENIALNFTPVIDISRGKVLQGNTEPSAAGRAAGRITIDQDIEVPHDHAH